MKNNLEKFFNQLSDQCLKALTSHKLTVLQAGAGSGKNLVIDRCLTSLGDKHNNDRKVLQINSKQVVANLLELIISKLINVGMQISDYEVRKISITNQQQALHLLNQSLPLNQQLFIIITQFQLLSPEQQNLIQQWLMQSPNNIHFFISSETQLKIDTGSLNLSNQVCYFSQESFVIAEQIAADYLNVAADADLIKFCQGWYKAISIAKQLSIQMPAEQIDCQLLLNNQISQFYQQELYSKLSAAQQKLLIQLILLAEFNLSQINQLFDIQINNALMPWFENKLFFQQEYISAALWFRPQPLLKQYLANISQQSFNSQQISEIKQQASQWLFANDFIEPALKLAFAIKDYDKAQLWLIDYAHQAKKRGHHQKLLSWLQLLPLNYVEQKPELASAYILCLVLTKQFVLSDKTNRVLASLNAPSHDIQRQPPLLSCITRALEDKLDNVLADINHWLQTWQNHPQFLHNQDYHLELGLALLVKAFCHKAESNFIEAEQNFNQAKSNFEAYQSDYGMVWADCLHSLLLAKQGLHQQALETAEQALVFCQRHISEQTDIQDMLSVLIATIYFERNQIEKARQFFPNNIERINSFGYTDILLAGFRTRYQLQILDNVASDKILTPIKQQITSALQLQQTRLAYQLINDLILLLINNNKSLQAKELAKQYKIEDALYKPYCHTAIIFLAINDNDLASAQQIIDSRLKHYQQQQRSRLEAEYLIIKAHVLQLQAQHKQIKDQYSQAHQNLVEAINICSSRQYISVFFYLKQPLKTLFEQIENNLEKFDVDKQFFQQLIQALYQQSSQQYFEKLSRKEIQVIKLAESGDTSLQLAEQLNISQGTVKWHLHNIYQKLKVKNRTQAIKQAKALGYLS